MPETPDMDAGEAVIEGVNIVIRVPIRALPMAFDACPKAPRDDDASALYVVTDATTFAEGVVRYLNKEEEDGTTPIHRMFDAAMIEALEQGEEGIEEAMSFAAPSPLARIDAMIAACKGET